MGGSVGDGCFFPSVVGESRGTTEMEPWSAVGDADVLRHDTKLAPRQIKQHLKHLPDYLVPKGGEVATGKKKKNIGKYVNGKKQAAKRKKAADPLK